MTAPASERASPREEAHRRVEEWLEAQGLAAERDELDLKGFDRAQVAYRVPEPVARS